MYKSNLEKNISIVALSLLSATSFAQQGGAITYGSIDLIPTLNIQAIYDDNIRSEEENPEDDTIITVTPSIRAQIDSGVYGLAFDYSLTKGEYLSNSNESYLDQSYGALFGWNIAGTHILNINVNVLDSHDTRTADAPSGLTSTELDEYKNTTWGINYSYGERSLLIGYELGASLSDREYTTNRNVTAEDDYESEAYNAQFNINPTEFFQINLLAGLGKTRYDDAVSADRESDEQSYGLGFSWSLSDSFDAGAKVSQVDKDFLETQREDAELERFDITARWSPYSYSSFTFGFIQSANESNTVGEDFVEVTTAQIAWNNSWTDIFSTNLSYAKSESDYVGSATGRLDDSEVVGLDMKYSFRRWIAINFGLSNTHERSNDTAVEFDKTKATLGAIFTL